MTTGLDIRTLLARDVVLARIFPQHPNPMSCRLALTPQENIKLRLRSAGLLLSRWQGGRILGCRISMLVGIPGSLLPWATRVRQLCAWCDEEHCRQSVAILVQDRGQRLSSGTRLAQGTRGHRFCSSMTLKPRHGISILSWTEIVGSGPAFRLVMYHVPIKKFNLTAERRSARFASVLSPRRHTNNA